MEFGLALALMVVAAFWKPTVVGVIALATVASAVQAFAGRRRELRDAR